MNADDDVASRWAWASGIPHELAYWRKWLMGKKGPEEAALMQSLFDRVWRYPFHPDVEAAINLPPGSLVRALDVGAGPASMLGSQSVKYDIQLTPIDALADDYRELLKELRLLFPPVPTVQCKAEEIGQRFGPDSFEVAHASNSLDHCADPLLAICEMVKALVPGGLLYIRTHDDEGERRGYAGFHGWNFQVRDGSLFLWRPGARRNLSEMFSGSRITEVSGDIVFSYTKETAECFT